jgi:hypothetical protein
MVEMSISLKSHVEYKIPSFRAKILKSAKEYQDIPTSFSGFAAEMMEF